MSQILPTVLQELKELPPYSIVCLSWRRVRGVDSISHVITAHEQIQLNQACDFISLVNSLVPNNLTIQNIFIFTAASLMPIDSCERLPIHHYSEDHIFCTSKIILFI